ncbi:hypothetical protein U9M48_036076 [Paspalum notatum var. saurae]|uniref:Integrase catalytic domain-containing protein n=1 Tax=Paspalum notatum var. saurae TaxID=547442 RepID=A0AAQ3UGH4_PASNO
MFECNAPPKKPVSKQLRAFAFDAHYVLQRNSKGQVKARFMGMKDGTRPKKLWVNYKTGGSHWVMDSGCTQHITSDSWMFTSLSGNIEDYDKITFGDNSKGKFEGLGKIEISSEYSISNVLLVDSLNFNLLSVGQLCDLVSNVYSSQMKSLLARLMVVKKSLRVFGIIICILLISTQRRPICKHVCSPRIQRDVTFEKDKLCSACQAGKQVANTHPCKTYMSTSRPLELLHMDLFGPTTYTSICGNNYGFVIVDDFSRYTWIYFLEFKTEVAHVFSKFAKRAQNEFNTSIVKIRSDNGTEFDNTNIEEYCVEVGIKHEFSATYTPQQNGVVERNNRTLITLARSMLDEYDTSEKFWAKAINTTCYASNQLYPHRLLDKTPYELLNGRIPNISYFQVFGCKCYINKKRQHLDLRHLIILKLMSH